jgi:glycosyltransferase involved in cell wall biosynthesis
MYLAEALAAGVPVVQPRFASFPEFVETTGGGVLYEPGDPEGLPQTLERLLRAPEHLAELASTGQRAVLEQYSAGRMAKEIASVVEHLAKPAASA